MFFRALGLWFFIGMLGAATLASHWAPPPGRNPVRFLALRESSPQANIRLQTSRVFFRALGLWFFIGMSGAALALYSVKPIARSKKRSRVIPFETSVIIIKTLYHKMRCFFVIRLTNTYYKSIISMKSITCYTKRSWIWKKIKLIKTNLLVFAK